MVASVVCYNCVTVLSDLDIDDALDVWGVHGMGGFTGTILLGLLADGTDCAGKHTELLDCANPGTVTRSGKQVMIQLVCAVIVAVYSFVVSIIVLKIIDSMIGIRPHPNEEGNLDESHHGEIAYRDHSQTNFVANDSETDDDESTFTKDGLQITTNGSSANVSRLPKTATAQDFVTPRTPAFITPTAITPGSYVAVSPAVQSTSQFTTTPWPGFVVPTPRSGFAGPSPQTGQVLVQSSSQPLITPRF